MHIQYKYIHIQWHFLRASLYTAASKRKEESQDWRGGQREVWLKSWAVNSEHPAMSWGDKKRHHLKLTQLFNCEFQPTPPPLHPTLSPSLSHTLSLHTASTRASRRPQTHNLLKTTKRATATANQDQWYNTQGKPTGGVMSEGHSLQMKGRN